MATNRIPTFSVNGVAPKPRTAKPINRQTKAERDASRQTARFRRRVAYGVAGVGVSILALSVVHCTEAIGLLTGSPWYLSALLAIGIDAGLVACELAELVGDTQALKRWALAYILLSIAVSMGLNAYSFARHATYPIAGMLLGIIMPAFVLILGRVYGHLNK